MRNWIASRTTLDVELKKWTKLVPVRGPPDLKASIQNNQIKISADLIDRVSYFFPYDDQVTDFSAKQNFSDSTLSFAALDTFENEPNPEIKLLMHDKISLTPHIGAATLEAQDRIGEELASQISRLLK